MEVQEAVNQCDHLRDLMVYQKAVCLDHLEEAKEEAGSEDNNIAIACYIMHHAIEMRKIFCLSMCPHHGKCLAYMEAIKERGN